MYLDYSKLEFDSNGQPEVPQLVLKTLGDKMVGIIPGVFNLKFNIKFSEPSEISFDIPAIIDGAPNPFYDEVTGYKQIYTKCYGVYETLNPTTGSDGIMEIKHVKGYSYEKTLESKKLFLEEGTFNFWNPASPTDTVLGRILEIATGWNAGYVSASLIGRYRTFDQYDDYLLSFVYNNAPQKYRCVFVFDTYKRTINVYDADEERPSLPIYLDFANLLESLEIEEKSDELVTAIRPYGADDLSIRDVNPTGTNWIYDLSYFIANGDIREPLASKWVSWQRSILNRQQHYRGLTGLRASATARLTAAKAELAELNGEQEALTAQQSVTIQAIAMETTSSGKASQQKILDSINRQISSKKNEIAAQENSIASIENELSSYGAQIQSIVNELSISTYFTKDEYQELSSFFIEQDITEETFVATDIDTTISGSFSAFTKQRVSIIGSKVSEISLTSPVGKKMYTMSGGTFSLGGSNLLSGDIIRGTLEVGANGSYVLSFYAGTLRANGKTAQSGMVTMSGSMTGFSSDVTSVTTRHPTDLGEDISITSREGTSLSFTASGSLYLTANVSEYQRYSVEMELYEYAVNILDDLATPTYEFSVDSGNFLFAKEFSAFRDQLELGKGVYLNIGNKHTITPYIIEFELDFEERDKFSIIFSNRFKRHDNVNTLKDMIESSYSSGRKFDASKYIYNQTVGQASMVSEFMANSLDAAKNTILAAANQSVIINGAGIHVGGDSRYQIRIVDSMIAMSDDNWATCKMALGHFASPEVGDYFGVNAEVIGGKLIVGNNLIIENANDRGVMQFKVDATGAWLYNATFILQSANASAFSARAITGGKIILDPDYGIVAGYGNLFTTSGTTVTPSFIDSRGNISFDSEGMPRNSNFFLDIRDGSAYFRGTIYAKNGTFSGELKAATGTFSGALQAATGTFSGELKAATGTFKGALQAATGTFSGALQAATGTFSGALQAATGTFSGALQAATGTFSGELKAASGTFKGTVQASRYLDSSGRDMMSSGKFTADYLDVRGLNVNNRFIVDSSGNVTIRGGSISWGAVTGTDEIDNRINQAQRDAKNAQDDVDDLRWEVNNLDIPVVPDYIKSTYIDSVEIQSPTITGNEIITRQYFTVAPTRYNTYGYMGLAYGMDADGYLTYGVALSSRPPNGLDRRSCYVIVTNAGVRLQSPGHSLTMTSTGCWVDGEKLGGGANAVWG